jgi:DNA-binding GntR family transcriptional regulator
MHPWAAADIISAQQTDREAGDTMSAAVPRTAQETVAEYLRSEILAGRLAAGSRLQQSEIAQRLGVSITPVREAFRDLVMEGLVDFDRFRGAVVHVPSIAELDEIFVIRQRLIPLSCELGVSRITPEELDECESLMRQIEAADAVTWSILNRQFHRILDHAAGNGRLTEILWRLADVATLYIHLTLEDNTHRRNDAEREHRELLDAYRNGDAAVATRVQLEHFEGTTRAAREKLMEKAASTGG